MGKIAVKIIFSGRVQGVGFRYAVLSLVGGYDVSGYVKNLSSGEVELFIQGEETSVDSLLDAVHKRMKRHILGQQRVIVSANPAIKDFRIRY